MYTRAIPTFLGLPAELRLIIYEYALCPGTEMRFAGTFHNLSNVPDQLIKRARVMNRKTTSETPRFPCVALLRTCHQVHAEAAPVLYSKNTFDFYPRGAQSRSYRNKHSTEHITSFTNFVSSIGTNAYWLRNINIRLPAITQPAASVSFRPYDQEDYRYMDILPLVLLRWKNPKCQFHFPPIGPFSRHRHQRMHIVYLSHHAETLSALLLGLHEEKARLWNYHELGMLHAIKVSSDGVTGYIEYKFGEQHLIWKQQFARTELPLPKTIPWEREYENLGAQCRPPKKLFHGIRHPRVIRRRWGEEDGILRGLFRRPEPDFENVEHLQSRRLVFAKSHAPELMTLPPPVLSRIYQLVLGPPKEIIVQVDPRTDEDDGIRFITPVSGDLREFRTRAPMYDAGKRLYITLNTWVFRCRLSAADLGPHIESINDLFNGLAWGNDYGPCDVRVEFECTDPEVFAGKPEDWRLRLSSGDINRLHSNDGLEARRPCISIVFKRDGGSP